MKQTAVEWLVQNIKEKGLVAVLWNENVMEQAKEMEKKQTLDAYREGYDLAINGERIPKL
jgi:hypothetical protein